VVPRKKAKYYVEASKLLREIKDVKDKIVSTNFSTPDGKKKAREFEKKIFAISSKVDKLDQKFVKDFDAFLKKYDNLIKNDQIMDNARRRKENGGQLRVVAERNINMLLKNNATGLSDVVKGFLESENLKNLAKLAGNPEIAKRMNKFVKDKEVRNANRQAIANKKKEIDNYMNTMKRFEGVNNLEGLKTSMTNLGNNKNKAKNLYSNAYLRILGGKKANLLSITRKSIENDNNLNENTKTKLLEMIDEKRNLEIQNIQRLIKNLRNRIGTNPNVTQGVENLRIKL